jgi:hypothetical protein
MTDFKIPTLEYCSLERATRIIGNGCEVEDLLHWALIGKIRLSANFDGVQNSFKLGFMLDDVDRMIAVIVENPGFYDGEYNVSKCSVFSSQALFDTEDDLRQHFNHRAFTNIGYKRPRSFHGSVRGVWDIERLRYDSKYSDSYIFDSLLPLDDSFGLPVVAGTGEHISFNVNDLLISKNNINIITGGEYGKLRELAYLDNNSVINEAVGNDEPGAKTNTLIKNRAAFIKALLAIHYGEDVADNPRKHIDNYSGELRKDFELAGIDLPSGKTVEGWLKGIDIKR